MLNEKQHCLVINLATRQVWCYLCDDEVVSFPRDNEHNHHTTEGVHSTTISSSSLSQQTKLLSELSEILSPPLVLLNENISKSSLFHFTISFTNKGMLIGLQYTATIVHSLNQKKISPT
jgi:hypothetical protein